MVGLPVDVLPSLKEGDGVREDRSEDLVDAEDDPLGASRQRGHEPASMHPGHGTRQHRAGADLVPERRRNASPKPSRFFSSSS